MKVDRSLEEVWEREDRVYQETKHLSVSEAARKIHEDVEEMKKKYGLKLRRFRRSLGLPMEGG